MTRTCVVELGPLCSERGIEVETRGIASGSDSRFTGSEDSLRVIAGLHGVVWPEAEPWRMWQTIDASGRVSRKDEPQRA